MARDQFWLKRTQHTQAIIHPSSEWLSYWLISKNSHFEQQANMGVFVLDTQNGWNAPASYIAQATSYPLWTPDAQQPRWTIHTLLASCTSSRHWAGMVHDGPFGPGPLQHCPAPMAPRPQLWLRGLRFRERTQGWNPSVSPWDEVF